MKQLIFCSIFLLITILASAQTLYTLNDMPSLYTQEEGTKLVVMIPANRFTEGGYTLYGTGTYEIYSDLRSAAIHSGAIRPEKGGIVMVEVKKGKVDFTASLQNGIQSKEAESNENSMYFTVTRDLTYNNLPGDVIFVDWITSSHLFLNEYEGKHHLFYPPNGKPWGFVYGTDFYTWDSHIGTAAVHAGKITFEKGGLVAVEFYPKGKKMSPYKGSTRNGVKTTDWNIPGSLITFHFVTAAIPVKGQQTATGNMEGAGITNGFVFVKLNSKEYNAAGFHANGDHVSILYDTTTGALQKICYQQAGRTDAVFISFDAEQRPFLIETKEAIYRYYNFKNNTASLVKAEPGRQPQVFDDVPFDWPPEVQQPGKEHGPSSIDYSYDRPIEITAAHIIKATGYALRVATCGLAVAASAGAAILPCTSVFVSAMADFLPDNNSAKKEFQKLETLIGVFESYAPQGFTKKRIMELLELAQTIAEKDLAVYETCKSIKGWLDARNTITNYIDPSVYGKPGNAPSGGTKPQNKPPASYSFTYEHTTFVSLFTLVKDDLKEETVQAALQDLGNNNYALLDAHGIFANVGKKVIYEIIPSPLDKKEGWERLMQKQKEGYKLVYVLLYSVLMKVEGYADPFIHEIKETKREDLVNANIKLTQEIANGYLKEGYEFIGMGLQNKTIRLFLMKRSSGQASYEMKFIGHDGLVNSETVKSLILQGYRSCGYIIAIYGKDPDFDGSPLPFMKEKNKAGYQCREVVLNGAAETKYDRKDFMEAVNKVTAECNKQVNDGYYLDFFLTEKNKIQIFFHK